jgi:hypothetical protein
VLKVWLLRLFGDKRILVLVILVAFVLYFVMVNNAGMRATAQTYLFGTLIVLAALPALKLIMH